MTDTNAPAPGPLPDVPPGPKKGKAVSREIALSNGMKVSLEYGADGSRTATLWNEANEPIADGEAPDFTPEEDEED